MAECSGRVSATYNLTLLAFCTATIELRNFFTLGSLKTKDVCVIPFFSERILGVGNLFLCFARVGMRRPYSAEHGLVDSCAFLYVLVLYKTKRPFGNQGQNNMPDAKDKECIKFVAAVCAADFFLHSTDRRYPCRQHFLRSSKPGITGG